MYSNIPEELRALKQWVCWREGKVPYQVNGQLANVTDLSTWNSFDACVAAKEANPLNLGIGFVFTEADPYSFIDLDNAQGDQAILATHIKIAHEFNSYSEVSPSGMGLHIIVKGSVAAGRRRSQSKVEIYSAARYATMTGNVHNNTSINDCQVMLSQLWEQMGSGPVAQFPHDEEDGEQLYADEEIIKTAIGAANSEKFKPLHEGRWKGDYPSQSEADLAYVNILQYYTKNRTQLARMFKGSALGKSDKKRLRKDYIEWTINKAFDRTVPNIVIQGFREVIETRLAQPKPPAKDDVGNADAIMELPSGLLGELASFIYAAAPRPVPEVALAAAIGLMAGITGRAYNISGTGLNQYVLLLAMTGAGKEAAASGISKLMNTIKMQVPTSTTFIGPSEISSGSALFKYLGGASQSFISLLGEFGLRLQQMSSPYANGAEVSLRRMFLDLYNKSGFNDVLQSSIYSKKEDSSGSVPSPSFSILGESTPERFYGTLDEDMISEGLLPRFLLIEYKGNRPPLNEQHTSVTPSFQLIERLAALCAQCETVNHSNPRRVINVQQTTEAERMLKEFNNYADNKINGSNKEVIRQLWNRAHLKVLKLSALIAVGENMLEPTIQSSHMVWAAKLVQGDIAALTIRFESGEIGKNSLELKQEAEIIRIVKEYVEKDFEYVSKYQANAKLHHDKIVSNTYLSSRLTKMAAFRKDKIGETNSLKRAIQNLIDNGKLIIVSGPDFNKKYGTTQKAFSIHPSILD